MGTSTPASAEWLSEPLNPDGVELNKTTTKLTPMFEQKRAAGVGWWKQKSVPDMAEVEGTRAQSE